MIDFLCESVFFGAAVSFIAYEIGIWIKKKFHMAIFNPLLIAVVLVIVVLCALGVDYEAYFSGAQYISYLLTPATVCLAIPLYEQLSQLRQHWKAIVFGIFSGVLTSLTGVLVLALLFQLDHTTYVTLLPKSITTAIGMGISEENGGIVAITVAVIIVTGVFGNIIADMVCKLFRITEPVAKGIGIGASSHAIGTTHAMELGEIEGAMSSLSIAVSGLLTVIGASIYSMFY